MAISRICSGDSGEHPRHSVVARDMFPRDYRSDLEICVHSPTRFFNRNYYVSDSGGVAFKATLTVNRFSRWYVEKAALESDLVEEAYS